MFNIKYVICCIAVCSGPVLALVLAKQGAVEHWRNLLGPKDPTQAKQEQPNWYTASEFISFDSITETVVSVGKCGVWKILEKFLEKLYVVVRRQTFKYQSSNITILKAKLIQFSYRIQRK